jgi:hypothetical protein
MQFTGLFDELSFLDRRFGESGVEYAVCGGLATDFRAQLLTSTFWHGPNRLRSLFRSLRKMDLTQEDSTCRSRGGPLRFVVFKNR